MKLKSILAVVLLLSTAASAGAERYAGADVSLLPDYEKAGAKYKDHSGNAIPDLLVYLHDEGMNALRVRLFVDPSAYSENDPNVCQTLDYIIPLCKRIKEDGFNLLLDFHYSDTWADPAKQWTPNAWKDLNDEQLYQKIYEYTRECLLALTDAGAAPDFIQPGNEISYGMLWGTEGSSDLKKCFNGSDSNWSRFGNLLKQAIKACHEVCPDAKIVLHNERVADTDALTNFYNRMAEMDVEYDIIGLSYYPYFHGDLSVLRKALSLMRVRFPEKNIIIAETGYPYKWEVPGTDHDNTDKWPYTDAGQDKFMKDLIALCESYEVEGIYWWWLEYNAFGTNLSNWYNAPLFDSTTGRATSALKTLCSFSKSQSGVGQIPAISFESENEDRLYNLHGQPVVNPTPGLYVRNGRKILICN